MGRVVPRLSAAGALVASILSVAGSVYAVDAVDMDHAPVFLLTGVAPNLILSLDNSASMSAAHDKADDEASPSLNKMDTAAVMNRLYYDPSIVYLPPKNPDGQSFGHADFNAALRDFFANAFASGADVDCTLNLATSYAPIWDENSSPCTEVANARVGVATTGNVYTIDRQHPVFKEYYQYRKQTFCVDLAGAELRACKQQQRVIAAPDWAKYCLYGTALPGLEEGDDEEESDLEADEEAVRCPAFYSLWDAGKDYSEGSCGNLDPENLTADQEADALPKCLDRIVVGTGEDINQTEAEHPGIHEQRAALLRTVAEADTELDSAYKKTLSKRNFANWFSYYRNRWRTLQSAITLVAADLDPSVRVAYQRLAAGSVDDTSALTNSFSPYNASSREAFQDWLFELKPPPTDITGLLSAAIRTYHFCKSDLAYLHDPAQLVGADLGDGQTNALRTCRNNFHLMFTDGVWEDGFGGGITQIDLASDAPWLDNNDGTAHDPLPVDANSYASTLSPPVTAYDPAAAATRIYADSNRVGLADVVFQSWVEDLRPADAARVSTIIAYPDIPEGSGEDYVFWNPKNDPADWQHITTYAVGMGLEGDVAPIPANLADDDSANDVVNYWDGTYGADDSKLSENGFPGDWSGNGLAPAPEGGGGEAVDLPTEDECLEAWVDACNCLWDPDYGDICGGDGGDGGGDVEVAAPTSAQRVDDLWHAGINGRGGYSSAKNPEALIQSFRHVIDTVSAVAQQTASAVAPSFNTGSAGSSRMLFQASLNSSDWTGDLKAFRVSSGVGVAPCEEESIPRGELCDDPSAGEYHWSAAEKLDDPAFLWSTRKIGGATASYGVNGKTQAGIQFDSAHWGNLSDLDKRALLGLGPADAIPAADSDAVLRLLAIMDYLAGDRDHESSSGNDVDPTYAFRDRHSILGDIIRAGPVVVSAPNRYFSDAQYQAFRSANADRTEIVYAGANDGMLHAFDVDSGNELFAYVPRPILGKLSALVQPGYGQSEPHGNFVDGPVNEGDAYLSGAGTWSSLVVGSLGLGAQAVYAIRSPNLGDDAVVNPSMLHLWDFTDRDDPDMGYVMGKPAIVRVLMSDGGIKWVAVFGNGYNSSMDDGYRASGCDDPADDSGATACGRAVLYVADIETGALVAKFDTLTGRSDDPNHAGNASEPNGLAEPTVIGRVLSGDDGNPLGGGDPIATVAYAGDLFGNLWRFNLVGLDAADTAGEEPDLIFTALDDDSNAQPITSGVAVAPHPTGVGAIVLFGTGRYLGLSDVSNTSLQTFYGIWDKGEAGTLDAPLVANDADNLLAQQLEKTNLQVANGAVDTWGRTSSRNAIDWGTHLGWRLDLIETQGDNLEAGERVIYEPVVHGDRVVFVSIIPEADPCLRGGLSWVNAVAYDSGSALDETPFDYDLNGLFDTNDKLVTGEAEGEGDAPTEAGSSIRQGEETIYSGPSSLALPGGITKTVVSDSEGELIELLESSALEWRVWRQLQ